MPAVAVFCGSSTGHDPRHARDAGTLAGRLAAGGVRIVYGGASVGSMGALADAALAAGGEVVGVIPRHLVGREVAHEGLTRLDVVGSMHERKAEMAARADAFVALPGGYGTLDELFEVLTWSQLGLHHKPCALLDVDGYYTSLVAFLDHAGAEGLLRPEHRAMLFVEQDPERLCDRLSSYPLPVVATVIEPGQT